MHTALNSHLRGRCGQAVSALVAAGLLARPELSISESEIYEWWLVSPELSEQLRKLRAPTLQFCELHMWGRTQTGVPVEQDPTLIEALRGLGSPRAAPPSRSQN